MLGWYMNSDKKFKWLDMGKIVLKNAHVITANILAVSASMILITQ
jgi:hypothetical protein